MHIKFEGVKGYATYGNAAKRGNDIAEAVAKHDKNGARFVVIALPNGRYAPCFMVYGDKRPEYYMHQTNVCLAN